MENAIREASPMPPEIAKAIVAVMGKVKQIGKDDENKFAKYAYVSVDKFFDQIGRLMADAGIFVVTDEVSTVVEPREVVDDYGKVKKSTWLVCQYEIRIYHTSGACYGPLSRAVQVQASGPQAYGSAQSYIEKYFLRSLFKIPTGEADADAHAQEGLPQSVASRKPAKAAAPTAAETYVKQSLDIIAACETTKQLRDWWKNDAGMRGHLFTGTNDPDFQTIRTAFEERGHALVAAENTISSKAAE